MLQRDTMQKALVIFAIEQGLIDGGGVKIFDDVIRKLKDKYNYTIDDCYKNPQYLIDLLCDENEVIRVRIITEIKQKLFDFIYQEPIATFIEILDTNSKKLNKTKKK